MLGKIAGAFIGKKVAGRNSGMRGALMGAGATALARRGLGPLALGAAAVYGGKKLYDRYRSRPRAYPSDAAPASPSGRRSK